MTFFGEDKAFWDKATTAMHIFFEEVKSKNIIGVTGTKGKGTTCTLIAEMLSSAGQKTWLGGNIGNSVLDFLNDVRENDWVVLEMSSFQLDQFPYSPHIAVCLMISEEHQDWHSDMEDYMDSKANIFRNQTKDDIAIYLDDDDTVEKIAGLSPGKKISYWGPDGAHVREDGMIVIGEDELEIVNKSEVRLVGEHNLQNVCAALTVFHETAWDLKVAKQVATSFSGLEHRLELVGEVGGVQYYDDSFGTTPDTAIVALRAFIQPVVMILGGSDKGSDYEELAKEVVRRRVRHVIAIGDTGPKIAELLRKNGYEEITENLTTMPEIVAAARKAARTGDVVLLSAASASYGLFKDYKDRGDQFKKAVQELS